MAKHNTTTRKTGERFVRMSRKSSPSTKSRKTPQKRVFGSSSQFKGVRVGSPGDPRK